VLPLARAVAGSNIGRLIAGFLAYVALLVFLIEQLGFWRAGLTFGVMFWTAAVGCR
jgi:hypothetical protein